MSDSILSGRGVHFSYGDRPVLSGVDLSIRKNEVAVLLGPNGAGKSTLIGLLSGLLRPVSGEILLAGRPPATYGRREIARLLSVAGREPPLDFPMSVEEYVALGRFPHQGFFGATGREDRHAVARALDMTELAPLRSRGLKEISAGERQRAVVARAIAQGAQVMLLDEPTAFLDIYHRVAFYEIVTRLVRECGVTALVASHDLSLAAEYGDRIFLLAKGTIRAAGAPEDVLTPQNIREAFGVSVACDRNPATGSVRVTPLRNGRRI